VCPSVTEEVVARRRTARAVASQLAIINVCAECLPSNKAAKIRVRSRRSSPRRCRTRPMSWVRARAQGEAAPCMCFKTYAGRFGPCAALGHLYVTGGQ